MSNPLRDKLAATAAAAGVMAGATLTRADVAAAAREAAPTTPMVQFDPSQRRLFDDEARVVVVCWHRQKGKDYTAAAKAVRSCLKTGQDWFIVSITQRQADATFAKCKRFFLALRATLGLQFEAAEGEEPSEQRDKWLDQSFRYTARELRFPNGGRVVSLPGRDPDALAGLTGNVVFTEFGLFPGGGYDHWRVVFPLTTRGFQCVVISTPRGKNTKFYELVQNAEGDYSVHRCDIHESVARDGFVLRDNAGRPTEVATFKRLYADAGGFAREYELEFTGDLTALVAWADLERAGQLGADAAPQFVYRRLDGATYRGAVNLTGLLGVPHGYLDGLRLALGWDVARRDHISSLAVNAVGVGGRPDHLVALVAMRGVSFELQVEAVNLFMALPGACGYGDETGIGMAPNEQLRKRHGDRWTPHAFTAAGKRAVGSALRTGFVDGRQTLPAADGPFAFVAHDVYAVQADETQGRQLLLSETQNPLMEESHCDIAYSLGLARLAGSRSVVLPVKAPLARKPRGF